MPSQESLQKIREALQQVAKPAEKLPKKGIKNIIAVVSGKGGVGKSAVTAMLACELQRRGFRVGVFDSDIGGASIARMFGLTAADVGKDIITSPRGEQYATDGATPNKVPDINDAKANTGTGTPQNDKGDGKNKITDNKKDETADANSPQEKNKPAAKNQYIATSKTGIKILSTDLLLRDPDRAVVWRGALISNALRDLYNTVDFGDLDFLLLDTPPGSSDVPITIYKQLPIDGTIVVSSPQELVHAIATKTLSMAKNLNVPVLGLVENLSYLICDKCQEKHEIFGTSKGEATAKKSGIDFLGALPIDAELTKKADAGTIEFYGHKEFRGIADKILGKMRLNEG